MSLDADSTGKITLPMLNSYLSKLFMQYDGGPTISLSVNQYTLPVNPFLANAYPTIITEYSQAKIVNRDLHELDFAMPNKWHECKGFQKRSFCGRTLVIRLLLQNFRTVHLHQPLYGKYI